MKPHALTLLYFLAAVCACVPSAASQSIIAQTGPGPGDFATLGSFVSINDAGDVAFIGEKTSGSQIFVATDGNVPGPIATSNGGTYSSVVLNSSPVTELISRELRPGPSYAVRRWPIAGGAATLVESSTTPGIDSISLYCDVNDLGISAMAALVNGSSSTQLLAGVARPNDVLATFQGSVPLRPQISNDNRVLVTDNLGRVALYSYPSGQLEVVASASAGGFSDVGRAPGITADGEVTFAADRGSGPGIFAAVQHGGGRQTFRLAGEGADDVTDINSFLRIAVFARGDLSTGKDIVAIFIGARGGVTGLYSAGIQVREENGVLVASSPALLDLARVGDPMDGSTYSGFFIHDPVNRHGALAFRASLADGRTAIMRIDGCEIPSKLPQPAAEKYKQGDSRWSAECLRSQPPSASCPLSIGTLGAKGCTLTCHAMAYSLLAGAAGLPTGDISPISVARWMESNSHLTAGGGMKNVGNTAYQRTFFSGAISIRGRRDASNKLKNAIDELRAGRPVMLGVPSMNSRHGAADLLESNKKHYVLAYAYDEGRARLYGDPAGILINDPGFTGDSYAAMDGNGNHLPGFVPGYNSTSLDALVHVSLHDYFAALTRRNGVNARPLERLLPEYPGCWGDDPSRDAERVRRWFDLGEVSRAGGVLPNAGPSWQRNQLITFFEVSTFVIVQSGTAVASPVEIALTSSLTGTRYVSDAAIQGPSDVLMERAYVDLDARVEEAELQDVDPAFPPYAVVLPPSEAGVNLGVEIIGVGNGPYTVAYQSTAGSRLAVESYSGVIATGQVVQVTFEPRPEVGSGYCFPTNPNSAEAAGVVEAFGSTIAGANDLLLVASNLPSESFGYFITSTAQGLVSMPAGSEGNLCLSGAIGRYVAPGQIKNSEAGGTFELALDLAMTPTPLGLVSVQSGETWNFQCWYRDAIGGSPTSHFTGARSVVFQ